MNACEPEIDEMLAHNLVTDKIKIYDNINVVKAYYNFEHDSDCDILNRYKRDYSCEKIFDYFLRKENFKDLFLPLIDPNQYKKALDEYIKFGKLMYFPVDIIYKWLGVILKNTVLIINSSAMACYFKYIPKNFIKSTLLPFYLPDVCVSFIDKNTIAYSIPKTDENEKMTAQKINDINIALDSQSNTHNYRDCHIVVSNGEQEESISLNNKLMYFFDFLDDGQKYRFYYAKIYGDKINISERLVSVMHHIGFYKWTNFYGYSEQMGLAQLFNLLNELKDNMTPEEILVWINKILDVYHMRSSISELFIKNGKISLNKISN